MGELTAAECDDLARCEAAVERGLATFIEVGSALLEIRERRLYRSSFDTFEAYCRARWGLVASRARQLCSAVETVSNLEGVTAVTPANEWQARPLMALPAEQQRIVWTRAVETAPNGRPTAAHVRRTVDELSPMDGPTDRGSAAPDGTDAAATMRARYRIVNDDCRRPLIDLGIDPKAIDAIVTDPPFGIRYRHSGCGRPPTGRRAGRRHATAVVGDDQPFDPAPWLDLGLPSLFWGGNHFHERLPRDGSWLCWDKTEGGRGPKDSFVDGEFAWCSVEGIKRNVIPYLGKGVCARKRGEENGKRYVPGQKPIGLMRRCIRLMGLPPDSLILDPYMGSGSTLIAALLEGHRGVGIEIVPHYCDLAGARIERRIRAACGEEKSRGAG